ncbi:hypothetical protein BCR44DRAFT_30724 [Catenaria anguillulae PL171]|uniref:L domain-like protein n=1 Tax=Catenaria anguillulae PL171 TaxID=765915 RepID=A0A1Y2HDQ4_9FUNG|nr:hypothetical protein BCR44DRAFT_30724 [Catenaria anguillulae PL171]
MSAARNTTTTSPAEPTAAALGPVNPDCAIIAKFGFLTPTPRDNSTCCQSPELSCVNDRVIAIKSTGRYLRNDSTSKIDVFAPNQYRIPLDIGNLTELNSINITFPESTKLVYLSNGLHQRLTLLPNLESLTIRNAGLMSSIPASIGNMTKLTLLDLSDNELSGPIPDSISQMTLTALRLGQNKLGGVVPPLPTTIKDCEIVTPRVFELNSFECYNGTLKSSPPSCFNAASSSMSRRLRDCPWIAEGGEPKSPHTRGGFILTIAVAILVPIFALICFRNAKRVKKQRQEEEAQRRLAEKSAAARPVDLDAVANGQAAPEDARGTEISASKDAVKEDESKGKRLRKCCCFPLGPAVKLLLVLHMVVGIVAGMITLSMTNPLTQLTKDQLVRANLTESHRDYLVFMVKVCGYLSLWGSLVSLFGLVCAVRKSVQGFQVCTFTIDLFSPRMKNLPTCKLNM